jgi:hypothetical protein
MKYPCCKKRVSLNLYFFNVIKVTYYLINLCNNVKKYQEKGDKMCIPHGAMGSVSNGFVKEDKPKKSIKRVSQDVFEKGDPNFVDERKTENKPKKEKGFLSSLF